MDAYPLHDLLTTGLAVNSRLYITLSGPPLDVIPYPTARTVRSIYKPPDALCYDRPGLLTVFSMFDGRSWARSKSCQPWRAGFGKPVLRRSTWFLPRRIGRTHQHGSDNVLFKHKIDNPVSCPKGQRRLDNGPRYTDLPDTCAVIPSAVLDTRLLARAIGLITSHSESDRLAEEGECFALPRRFTVEMDQKGR